MFLVVVSTTKPVESSRKRDPTIFVLMSCSSNVQRWLVCYAGIASHATSNSGLLQRTAFPTISP